MTMSAERNTSTASPVGLDMGRWQALLARDAAYAEAQSICGQSQFRLNVFGLEDTAKALAAYCLGSTAFASRATRAVFIVADILRARRLAEDLSALLSCEIKPLNLQASRLGAQGVASRAQEIERLSILQQFLTAAEPALPLIVPVQVLLEHFPQPAVFLQHGLTLLRGQHLDLEQLIEQLLDLGYERCRQIDSPGQFALRGDILDIAWYSGTTASLQGLRLSFFDTELDDLRLFDLDSQRSLQTVTEASIAPARQMLLSRGERQSFARRIRQAGMVGAQEILRSGGERKIADRLREQAETDALSLENGTQTAGLERWIHVWGSSQATLSAYFAHTGATVILDEPLRLRSRLDAAAAEIRQEGSELLLKGRICAQALEQALTPPQVLAELDKLPRLISLASIKSSGNGLPAAAEVQLYSHAADKYRGRENFLFQDLRQWRQQGWQIVLAASSEKRQLRLRELLNEESLTLAVDRLSLNEGFIWGKAKLAVLGSVNLFGQEKKVKTKKKSGLAIDFFSDLLPGELVVHEDHGVGRYIGLETLENSGAKCDYLKIVYQGDDVLYIPTDRLDEIQKYVAGDKEKPRLAKLGGQEWQKQKERVRNSVRALATDLLQLYAKRQKTSGHACAADTVWQQEFEDSFPYEETSDQLQAIGEIKQDMESGRVMDRLLCGDVGFGKTEIAFRALFKAVMDGRQALLLAPTTVLAKQHFDSFKQRLAELPVRLRLLSRFVPPAEQKQCLRELEQGQVDILVGTHRILSQDIKIAKPGLLVIDEEQRFGVDHKEQIKARFPQLDVLSLSATPIPRTLHMSMTGIRDISVLEEGPEDRRAVETFVLEYQEDIINEAILRELARNGQVFYLFNNTHKIAGKAAELAERLPGARIAYAHGKMSEHHLEDTIAAFVAGEYDILVCTTIIESGIDMPHVNTLIVEDANRMGLAQLYQLRGRVGRSERQAYAYITYQPDKVLSEEAEKRLAAIRDYTELGSGFRIALRDLEVRGAGSLLGAEQSGHLEAVGYDMYCRLLDEALRELKGEALPEAEVSCVLDFAVDAMIPASYIADEGQRMDLYRRVLHLQTPQQHQDLLDELIDRYGEPVQAVLNLLDLALARARASAMGLQRIQKRGQDLYFTWQEGKLNMEAVASLMQKERLVGRLLFNAGQHPFLLLKNAASSPEQLCLSLRRLFS